MGQTNFWSERSRLNVSPLLQFKQITTIAQHHAFFQSLQNSFFHRARIYEELKVLKRFNGFKVFSLWYPFFIMLQKKICMLGAFAVGKTSLVARYVKSIFSEKYLTTVG